MTPDSWWRRRAGCAHKLMAGSFAHGMGRLNRAEPRMAAALQDILARPGSLVRAVAAYLMGIEMGVTEEAARAIGCSEWTVSDLFRLGFLKGYKPGARLLQRADGKASNAKLRLCSESDLFRYL